jgi:hypothetical protein
MTATAGVAFGMADASSGDAGSAERLRQHVEVLAGEIGKRSLFTYQALERAARYIEEELEAAGYAVESQEFEVRGKRCRNLIASRSGSNANTGELVLGAHYDTDPDTPGADDNASGVAVLLELARLAAGAKFERTVRFVAFTNEEAPWFGTDAMGSRAYARRARQRGTQIDGMISLEMVGYYSDRPGSQSYPPGFRFIYPDRGNFIALVSDFRSWGWKNELETLLLKNTTLPVESIATFRFVPGVDLSDHRSFWNEGYRALMITDTAFYRNPNYHRPSDTPETLDYRRMAALTAGLWGVLQQYAQ